MDSCLIEITPAAKEHGNLNIRACGRDFFPSDVYGGPSKKDGMGLPIALRAQGLHEVVQTDIPKDKEGNPRWIFRKRKWVKTFVSRNKLKPGDAVNMRRVDERIYEIAAHDGKHKIKDMEIVHKTLKATNKLIDIGFERMCDCPQTHINCLHAKEWLKCQLGVWQFTYEGRDIRDKNVHPATFPIALAHKVIELFTHKGELVLDPFVGIGTTMIAANDLNRNCMAFDLQSYIYL
ncbi:MAG: site-specific DNA-methyltransferase [Sedimentisphaerales bacterium]|nr:site-specific DNA-methyltransferase [Sedimentisphaerales bacterium]